MLANKSLHWTAEARFLLRVCRLQSWSKFGILSLVELVYHQTGVCTPTLILGQVAVGQPVNSSVSLLVKKVIWLNHKVNILKYCTSVLRFSKYNSLVWWYI